MSAELAAPLCQADSVQPAAVLALQLCALLHWQGLVVPAACILWVIVRGPVSALPSQPPRGLCSTRVCCKEAEASLAFSSRETPAPPPASDSLGCISKTVRKSLSEVTVRKPISALG